MRTSSPRLMASVIVPTKASTALPASALVRPARSATAAISSVWFMIAPLKRLPTLTARPFIATSPTRRQGEPLPNRLPGLIFDGRCRHAALGRAFRPVSGISAEPETLTRPRFPVTDDALSQPAGIRQVAAMIPRDSRLGARLLAEEQIGGATGPRR